MAEVKESFKELAEADLIPEADYMMRVISAGPRGEKGWEMARCGFVDPPDKELSGRTIDYFLGRAGDWRGLSRLLQAAQIFDLPVGPDGKQTTEGSLPGLEFPASVYRGSRNGLPQNQLSPNIDYQWVEANAGKAEGAGTSTRKSTKKASPRRRRQS